MSFGNNPYQNGGAPWPPPAGAQATLNPPNLASHARNAPSWYQKQVYWPELWFPAGNSIGLQLRRRPISVTVAANTATPTLVQFDTPTTIYALTAGVQETTGGAFPVGQDPLNLFTIEFIRTQGDRLDTAPALGGALLGTAARPALLGGPGWMFDRGGALQATITPLVNNLRIDVVLMGIEVRGPANFSWPTGTMFG